MNALSFSPDYMIAAGALLIALAIVAYAAGVPIVSLLLFVFGCAVFVRAMLSKGSKESQMKRD